MTAIAQDRAAEIAGRRLARRVWNVVRLQFTNRWNMFALPWIVLGAIFLLDIGIWVVINASAGKDLSASGSNYGAGATWYIYFYMLVVAIQALNLTFPFALGYSVTRRDYYLGTCLAFVIQSAMFTVGIVLLSYIEQWTNGWGWRIHLFHISYFGNGTLWERLLMVFALFLFAFFLGTLFGTFYVRWKVSGAILLGGAIALLIFAAVALISFSHSWLHVWNWFATTGTAGVLAWSLIPTVVAAAVGYLVLRRATPRD